MPSTHTQVMAFLFLGCMSVYWHRRQLAQRSNRPQPVGQQAAAMLELMLLGGLTATVAIGRVVLGYHTAAQVLVGGVLGGALGVAWFFLAAWAAKNLFPTLERKLLRSGLHLRDSLACPDIHMVEFEACRKHRVPLESPPTSVKKLK